MGLTFQNAIAQLSHDTHSAIFSRISFIDHGFREGSVFIAGHKGNGEMRKILMVLVLSLGICSSAFAHEGKLDAKGCHHDRKAGEYHCHKPPAAQFVGVSSVIDGDTVDIHGQRFRLFGIDAPESKQTCKNAQRKPYRCGQVAANALSDLIGSQTLSCEKRDVDRYKRVVAICSVKGQDVAKYLVAKGLAVAYVRYSSMYVLTEAAARSEHLGLWAGTFDNPWDWRKVH